MYTSYRAEKMMNGHQPEGLKKGVLRNQFGEESDGRMDIEKWNAAWNKGRTRFHVPVPHKMLVAHYDKLTGGRDGLRFFLPLCGKSVDLKWLAEKGHEVVGLEAVELGCKQFFEENNIQYTVEQLPNAQGKLLKSKDEKLKISLYACDFFDANRDLLGTFDCVWDRGSFAAINPDERKRYSEVMVKLLQPSSRYLLSCFFLDHEVFSGPPHRCTKEDLAALFGEKCDIEFIQERDVFGEWQKEWGVTFFIEYIHMLTLKSP